MAEAYIGTDDGIARLAGDTLEPLGLAGERVQAIHAAGSALLAGTYENGLHRRAAGGRWERVAAGMTAACIRWLGPDPGRPGALLAGTEPARLFRSEDDGATWAELDGVTRVAGHADWFLPYSPRAGAVRNLIGRPGLLLASVEVGGLLRSEDGGATWSVAPIIADEDIHLVIAHPDEPDVLFAALGTAAVTRHGAGVQLGGVARSRDGGRNWEKLEQDYTRAVLVPPGRPDLLLAGPARRVGRGGRIVVSGDSGDSWRPADAGLATPMPDMVELFVPAPDGSVWAICSGGRLLRADPADWRWEPVPAAGAGGHVRSAAFAP